VPDEDVAVEEPRKRKKKNDKPEDDNGTPVPEEEVQGVPADDSEIEAIKSQLTPADRLTAPIEDYRALSQIVGRGIISLVKAGINPYHCVLEVSRRSPTSYQGREVRTGQLDEYDSEWPFDVKEMKKMLREEQGGRDYVFTVKHEGKPLKSFTQTVDAPPQEAAYRDAGAQAQGDDQGVPVEELPPPPEESEEIADISTLRKRELERTKLLRAKQMRLQAERDVEELQKPVPPPAPELHPDGEVLFTRDQVEEVVRQRDEKVAARKEVVDARDESNRRFETLITEMKTARSSDGGLTAVLSAMQSSNVQMMEGLKMVVENVGNQLRSSKEDSKSTYENLVKMMEMSQKSTAALVEAQAAGRARETELLMKMATGNKDAELASADKQMSLIRQGMDFAKELQAPAAPAEDGEMAWTNKAGNMLMSLIGAHLAKSTLTPTPAAPAPPGGLYSEEQVEGAAQRIAARAATKIRGMRGHPAATTGPGAAPAAPAPVAPQAPPADGQHIRTAWAMLAGELDSLPEQSSFTRIVVDGPPGLLQGIGRAEKISEVISLVAPYVQPDEIGAVGGKMLNPEAQGWMLKQVMTIKAEYARRVEARRRVRAAKAPAPAAPVATPPPAAPVSPDTPATMEGEDHA